MKTSFTLRPAESKDLDILVDFNSRLAWETEHRRLDLTQLRQSMQQILQDPHKGVYWLACDGNQVVGQMMYVFEWSTWRNKNFMWITDLYILPSHRKQGVFKLLSEHMMKLYRENPEVIGLRFYVDKQNTAVVDLYKKVGWKESNYNLWEIKKDGCL